MLADKVTIEDFLSDETFINYCRESVPEDCLFWEKYITENPDKRVLVEHAKEKYLQLFNALAQADLEEQTERLNNSISLPDSAPVIQMEFLEKEIQFKIFPLLLKITAIAILVIGVFFSTNYFTRKPGSNIKTYAAVYGEKKNIQLPDGSIVTLNAGSNISINEKYGVISRDIYLEGEAFFEVKHDTSHPFFVHTQDMDIKALGTAFNVKAYLNEKITETSLIRGLVEVTLKEDHNLKTLLFPNQKIRWQHHGKDNPDSSGRFNNVKIAYTSEPDSLKKKLILTNGGDIKETAWKENKLIFEDERFDDIALLLERWYGASIYFNDNSIRSYRFTGIFEKEELKTVLDFLKESKNFNYTIEQGKQLNIKLSK
jgi:ferric-dicitrate binding protein FerR (iron transport regulator)